MATRKTLSQRQRKIQTPARRKRVASSELNALSFIDTLRKFADRRMTLAELQREGFTLPPKAKQIRTRIKKFVRSITDAATSKPLRRRA
jgi:hypothetical protein